MYVSVRIVRCWNAECSVQSAECRVQSDTECRVQSNTECTALALAASSCSCSSSSSSSCSDCTRDVSSALQSTPSSLHGIKMLVLKVRVVLQEQELCTDTYMNTDICMYTMNEE
jgi:hypothetical protein